MLPNFFCIGAQKSGTTSIWHILNAHPDIHMSATRETRFFFDDILYQEGLSKYEIKYFRDWRGEKMIGEKCPEYLCGSGVAQRIVKNLGSNIKFIVCLRNPAQRAFSQYRHNLVMLRESRSFEDALAEDAACIKSNKPLLPAFGYIVRGCYGTQLQVYLDHFASDQFLFTNFEDEIISDQKNLTQKVYQFLNVHPFSPKGLPFVSGKPPLEKLTIKYDEKKNFVEIDNQLGTGSIRKILNKQHNKTIIWQPSNQLVNFVKQFNIHIPSNTQLSNNTAKLINQKYFEKEIILLQQITKKDYTHWLN